MLRLVVAGFALAFVGMAFAMNARAPIVDIGVGAQISGPVTIRGNDGGIVLDVPAGSYIKTIPGE